MYNWNQLKIIIYILKEPKNWQIMTLKPNIRRND